MRESDLPTDDECFAILKRFAVPPHIIDHSVAVASVGVFLAGRMNSGGICVDSELVRKAGLLHDMLRVCDCPTLDTRRSDRGITRRERLLWKQLRAKYSSIGHEEAAYELLKDKYPALALVVKRHRYAALLDETDRPRSWEEKLLYYADKRVMHDRIVPLGQRLQEGHRRNRHMHRSQTDGESLTNKVDPLIFDLEREIFEKIDLEPLEVTEELVSAAAGF